MYVRVSDDKTCSIGSEVPDCTALRSMTYKDKPLGRISSTLFLLPKKHNTSRCLVHSFDWELHVRGVFEGG